MIHVANIQRMCFDDGPGIRTTVFLQGCSIHCPWCSNPETIPIAYKKNERGRDYMPRDLADVLYKDKLFWGDDGGVTFSGGEPLLQSDGLQPLWEILKEDGINLVVETSLFVSDNMIELSMPYINMYYVDIKLMNGALCSDVLGGELCVFEKNVEALVNNNCNLCFRIPCSIEYTLQPDNKSKIISFLKRFPDYSVEIFAIHDLARSKYEKIGMEMPQFESVPEKEMELLLSEIQDIGCDVRQIKL